MQSDFPVAIVGGGPAGASAALLASAGKRVVLFDEKLAWEKPCGGGITHKALEHWPFLADANVERNWIRECQLISSSGRRVSLPLQQPVAIFSRRVLNGLLLDRARGAGAEVIQSRVTAIENDRDHWRIHSSEPSYEVSFVILAGGARNILRKQFSQPFAPDDLMVTAGYYVPGHSDVMKIEFLKDLHGYVWIFPRADHLSAGICGKMQNGRTTQLRQRLENSLHAMGVNCEGARFYSHILPSLRASTLREAPICGRGWAIIGDAAGFVDPMTGEGLYYAMRSAELLAQAFLAGQPQSYRNLIVEDFLPELELASVMADRFYDGRWMGEPVIERMLQFVRNSPSFRTLMSDLFAGTQEYRDLRRRLYFTLPAILTESLVAALHFPNIEKETRAA